VIAGIADLAKHIGIVGARMVPKRPRPESSRSQSPIALAANTSDREPDAITVSDVTRWRSWRAGIAGNHGSRLAGGGGRTRFNLRADAEGSVQSQFLVARPGEPVGPRECVFTLFSPTGCA
jgi:hypothetical protein